MSGKWSGLRGDLPPAPIDSAWQQEVNIVKTEILQSIPQTSGKAREYCKLRDEKDRLEAEVKKLNTRLEALSQLMIKEMELEGTDLFRLDTGDTLSIKDEPYSSVADRTAFLAWIHQTGQDDLLSVHYQTMNSIVKSRLQEGGEQPPGIKVFLKQSITRRKGRGTNGN